MFAHRLLLVVVLALLAAGACGGSGGTPRPRPTPSAPPPSGGQPAAPRVPWTHAAVLKRIAGRRIVAGGQTVPIDPNTVTCVGLGRPVRRHGEPAWASFRCVQPTFPPGSLAGPDAIFEVRPTGATTFAVANARLAQY